MSKIEGNLKIFHIKQDGVYVPVVCTTSHSFSEETEMFNTTTRANGKWATAKPNIQNYGIEVQGLADTEGFSLRLIRLLKRNELRIGWGIGSDPNNIEERGIGYITNVSADDPVNNFRSFSMTVQGYGDPELVDFALGVNLEDFLNDGNGNLIAD